MENIGFYNGKWDRLENLSMPVLDRAVYFGDGIYDAAYTRNKVIFALHEHIARFFAGLKKVGILLPYDEQDLENLLLSGVERCDDPSLFVYFQGSCGSGVRNHADRDKTGNLLVMIYPKPIAPPEKTLRLLTLPDRRYGLCDVKTLNLMPNVLAAQKAESRGMDEAVLVRNGEVAECAHSNIQILKNGVLISPPPSFCTLAGIGRKHLIAACHRLSVPVEERRFSLNDLYRADEIIVTSAGYPCQRADFCDDFPCGGAAPELFSALSETVYREIERETDR